MLDWDFPYFPVHQNQAAIGVPPFLENLRWKPGGGHLGAPAGFQGRISGKAKFKPCPNWDVYGMFMALGFPTWRLGERQQMAANGSNHRLLGNLAQIHGFPPFAWFHCPSKLIVLVSVCCSEPQPNMDLSEIEPSKLHQNPVFQCGLSVLSLLCGYTLEYIIPNLQTNWEKTTCVLNSWAMVGQKFPLMLTSLHGNPQLLLRMQKIETTNSFTIGILTLCQFPPKIQPL